MAKKPAPRDAMFDAFERQATPEGQQVLQLLDDTARKIDRAKNPFYRSVTEFELQELADVLRRGASPSVEFEPDMAAMSMKAAEASRAACRAALEILAHHIEQVEQHNCDRK